MANSIHLDIKPLDFSTIHKDTFILFVGKRGSGKTNWARAFLDRMPDRDNGIFIVMAGSPNVRKDWSKYIHRLYIVEPSVRYLEKLRDNQLKLVEKYNKNNMSFPSELHVTLILDDIAASSDIMKSPILAWFASNGRHIELRILLLLQHLTKQCPTEIRSQAEIVFIHATGNRRMIASIHDEFAGCCEIRIFRSILSAVTENYGVLAIDNRANALNVEDCCYYAKHDITNIIKPFGSTALRIYADTHHFDMDISGKLVTQNDMVNTSAGDVDKMYDRMKMILNTNKIYKDRIGQVIIRRTL